MAGQRHAASAHEQATTGAERTCERTDGYDIPVRRSLLALQLAALAARGVHVAVNWWDWPEENIIAAFPYLLSNNLEEFVRIYGNFDSDE